MKRIVLQLDDDQQALLVTGYGVALVRRETDGSIDIRYPEESVADSRVSYLIEGNLNGKGWVSYATLGLVPEQQATGVFREWQESRDRQGLEIRYRLIRRITSDEIVLSEQAA